MAALDLMAKKLDCGREAFQERYLEHYEMVKSVFEARLPVLGEGKAGFAPEFRS